MFDLQRTGSFQVEWKDNQIQEFVVFFEREMFNKRLLRFGENSEIFLPSESSW